MSIFNSFKELSINCFIALNPCTWQLLIFIFHTYSVSFLFISDNYYCTNLCCSILHAGVQAIDTLQ